MALPYMYAVVIFHGQPGVANPQDLPSNGMSIHVSSKSFLMNLL